MVPDVVRPLLAINPIAWIVGLFQAVLYYGETPSLPIFFALTGVAAALGLFGYTIFNWKKREFAEIV